MESAGWALVVYDVVMLLGLCWMYAKGYLDGIFGRGSRRRIAATSTRWMERAETREPEGDWEDEVIRRQRILWARHEAVQGQMRRMGMI